MKFLHEWWENFLTYPGNRSLLFLVSLVVMTQALGFALCQNITGSISSSSEIYLGFVSFSLPFQVSRLWDIFIGPLYVFSVDVVESCEFLRDADGEGSTTEDCDTNTFGILITYALHIAFLVSLFFGVVYFLPIFVITFVFLLCICLSFGLAVFIRNCFVVRT